jgi:hypothetical protein
MHDFQLPGMVTGDLTIIRSATEATAAKEAPV